MKRFLLLLLLAARGFASLAQSTTPVNPIRTSLPPFTFPTPISASEQGPPLTAFADSINRIFQAVDKSRVTSGILEEYGLQFIDHTPFTGTNGYSVANQLNINRWRAIYGDLRGARINSNAAAMPSLAAVNQALDRYAADANVELPILHFNYHSIRTDALSSGAIQSTNNRLYDVPGRDPYQLNSAFAVAASDVALPSATSAFIFRSDLFWTNTGRTVASIQTDFADGNGFVNMSWNAARTVSYPTAGLKDVRVQVGYTDGSTWQSHLQVLAPAPTAANRSSKTTNSPLSTNATYSGIANESFNLTASTPYLGQAASALISIEYSGTVGVLDKPLIIVKGFDVSSILPVGATPFSPIGRFTYGAYIYDTFNKISAGGSLLGSGAYQDGYDIVYVDLDNGVDYIQRNAYLLETVIAWVNQHKTGNQPNKMLGLSFGGIIAQYALRDIEEAGSVNNNAAYPHQVGLLITHDSPSQGANVPLSIQMLVRKLAGTTIRNPNPFGDDIVLVDRYPLLGKARDALLSPASQQLLRYQTQRALIRSGFSVFYGDVTAAETSLYDSFQQEYQAKLGPAHVPVGTPGQPCRVVAVSNGTECGLTQPYGPYALLAAYSSDEKFTSFGLLDVLKYTILGSAGVGTVVNTLLPAAGPTAIAVVGLASLGAIGFTGAYDLSAVANLRALPDHQALPICDIFLQVTKHTRLFGVFRLQFDLLKYQGGSSLASQLPLDSGSGSIVSIADYASQFGSAASAIPAGAIKVTQFCFEPTYSALNITPNGTPALSAQYSSDRPVGTPFANFRTATRQNESHVQYTDVNSSWMLKELRQTPQVLNCAAFCQATPTINLPGIIPGTICGSDATFSINGLPAGSTVTWDLTTAAAVSNRHFVGPTFTTRFIGGNGAGGTVTAAITSDCGNILLSAKVYAGPPPTPLFSGPTDLDCFAYSQTYYITNYDEKLTYTLRAGGVLRTKPVLPRVGSFQVLISQPGQGYVNVTASNDCGSVTNTLYINVNPCTNARYTAYPNPANDEVQVEQAADTPPTARPAATEATNPPPAAGRGGITTVRLYDSYGQLRLEQDGHGNRAVRLRVGRLPAGPYVLHIVDQQGVASRQQLMIEH